MVLRSLVVGINCFMLCVHIIDNQSECVATTIKQLCLLLPNCFLGVENLLIPINFYEPDIICPLIKYLEYYKPYL